MAKLLVYHSGQIFILGSLVLIFAKLARVRRPSMRSDPPWDDASAIIVNLAAPCRAAPRPSHAELGACAPAGVSGDQALADGQGV